MHVCGSSASKLVTIIIIAYRDAETLKSCLSIELHREKVFSQSQEIAAIQTPLCYINHSSQVNNEGAHHMPMLCELLAIIPLESRV